MSQARESRRAGGSTAAGYGEKIDLGATDVYPGSERKTSASKARRYLPWCKRWVDELRSFTVNFDLEEKGLTGELLDDMHRAGEPIPADPRRLAKRLGTTKPRMEKMLAALVASGLFHWDSEGFLWSDHMREVVADRQEIRETRSKNASEGWEKRQQNQRSPDAKAYRSERGEGESSGGGPSGPSPTDRGPRSTLKVRREDTPFKGGPPTYNVEDIVDVSGLGSCMILEKIGARKFLVRRIDDGDTSEVWQEDDGTLSDLSEVPF